MVNGKLTQGLGVSSSPAERERTGNRLSRERWGKAATDLKILLGSPHLPVACGIGSLLLPLEEREKTSRKYSSHGAKSLDFSPKIGYTGRHGDLPAD
jgi:hypothetical protein